MSIKYISINIYSLSSDYIAKVLNNYELEPNDITLVYDIVNDRYFVAKSPPQVWSEEFICIKQDEFIQTVEQYKLLKLLNQ